MKCLSKKGYYFCKKCLTAENIKAFIFCCIALCIIVDAIVNGKFSIESLIDTKLLFSIILLLISDLIANFINNYFQNRSEDYIKETDDYNYLVKKYTLSKLIIYDLNNYNIRLPYELVYKVNSDNKLIIKDVPNKFYELPKQVANNSDYIFDVHKGSIVYNNINIRLDNFEIDNKNVVLSTSRTHYFDSLLTNRACDLLLNNGRSIRETFEPGPYIKPFSDSKMSNHLGFNGIIRTTDNYIPLVIRSRDVSIAKGVLSTSVSASLKTKYAINKENYLFDNNGLANAIRNEIIDELNLNLFSDIESLLSSIKFFYRDLVECGKPQFFIYLDVPYSKEFVNKCFYSDCGVGFDREERVKKDGSKLVFFMPDQLFKLELINELGDNNINSYKKVKIDENTFSVTPGMLMSIKFLKMIISG